jgi:hypothetical protein
MRSVTSAPSVTIALILSLVGFAGCSRTPDKLARQIADADKVVAKCAAGSVAVSNTYSGEDARRLIKAVSRAKLDPRKDQELAAAAGSSLLFYKRTNLLAEVRVFKEYIWTDEGRFIAKSGSVEEAYDDVNRKFRP